MYEFLIINCPSLCFCFVQLPVLAMKPAVPRNKCHGIPPGRGPFVVGLADVMSDNSINGTFTRLYYPTDLTADDLKQTKQPLWIPNRAYSDSYSEFTSFTSKFSKWLFHLMFGSYRVPAIQYANVRKLAENQTLPVVVFSHGLGAMRTTYTTICLELASQGFFVAAVEHRDKSACATYYLKDGDSADSESEYKEEYVKFIRVKDKTDEDFKIRNGQVNQRADECIKGLNLLEKINNGTEVRNYLGGEFDLSQFKGLLDFDKLSMIGHSFGGGTAIQTLKKEQRFKVGVAFDPWMYPLEKPMLSTITQPLLIINSEHFQWAANVAAMTYLVNPTNQIEDRKMLTLRETVHQSQSDFTFLTSKFIGKLAGLQGDADPYVAMDNNNDALIAFISKHLGIDYDSNLDKVFTDDAADDVIHGTNIQLDPERLPKASL
ncbi:platelet-activating factor acetylhydrolase-like [Antedon mediterranea]|uniref:platelet-activating factor acetylhydrolase-like n=1 Tax=Antedon mediterranea TaxID=105859 RepID=UPI003AF483AA